MFRHKIRQLFQAVVTFRLRFSLYRFLILIDTFKSLPHATQCEAMLLHQLFDFLYFFNRVRSEPSLITSCSDTVEKIMELAFPVPKC